MKAWLAGAIVVGSILLVTGWVAPALYRSHVTTELAGMLDEQYGKDGWVAPSIVSDNQRGEQIHLYRTLYLRLLYPKFLSLTPYKDLQFTHKAGWANVPPHYAVLVYSADGEYSYRWSMKQDAWYIAYQNSINILPEWDQRKILAALTHTRRVDGLNTPGE